MKKEPLHLIIDGSDNLGKTTVILMLEKALGIPTIKMPHALKDVNINKDNVEEYSKFFSYTITQFRKYPFIMDRGFTSSEVYAKVFNRKAYTSYTNEIEDLLDPVVVILTGRHRNGMTGEVTYKSFCKDPMFNEEEKKKVDEEFCRLAEERGYTLIEVNGKTPLSIADQIMKLVI